MGEIREFGQEAADKLLRICKISRRYMCVQCMPRPELLVREKLSRLSHLSLVRANLARRLQMHMIVSRMRFGRGLEKPLKGPASSNPTKAQDRWDIDKGTNARYAYYV